MALLPFRMQNSVREHYDYDDVMDFIGSGTFANVFRATYIADSGVVPVGTVVALKIIEKRELRTDKQCRDVINEVDLLRRVHHPNCVQMLEVFQTTSEVVIALDFIDGCELLEAIKTSTFTEERARSVTRQILSALAYLHNMLHIVHRDLKPENILIRNAEAGDHVAIVDFGLARAFGRRGSLQHTGVAMQCPALDGRELPLSTLQINRSNSLESVDSMGSHCNSPLLTTPCGTLRYAAPETVRSITNGGQLVTTRALLSKVDLYAVGIIVYVLLSGTTPFGKLSGVQLTREMEAGPNFTGRRWETVSVAAKQFTAALLVTDPSKRPSATQALAHEWLAEACDGDTEESAFAGVAEAPHGKEVESSPECDEGVPVEGAPHLGTVEVTAGRCRAEAVQWIRAPSVVVACSSPTSPEPVPWVACDEPGFSPSPHAVSASGGGCRGGTHCGDEARSEEPAEEEEEIAVQRQSISRALDTLREVDLPFYAAVESHTHSRVPFRGAAGSGFAVPLPGHGGSCGRGNGPGIGSAAHSAMSTYFEFV